MKAFRETITRHHLTTLLLFATLLVLTACSSNDSELNGPVVTITTPTDPVNLEARHPVTFSATATDAKGNDLSGSILWTSDKDGTLSTGASISAHLSMGTHTVTASVTDAARRKGQDSIVVEVANCIDPVYIDDGELEEGIRATLDKPSGDISCEDMERLTEANFEGYYSEEDGTVYGISSLEGLQYARNLTHLDLGLNRISDISPLAGLTNLTELNLFNNQLSDISALANLTNLTELRLSSNRISDISALAKLTNLTGLSLDFNWIGEISDLLRMNLPELTLLDLEYNQISDISALAQANLPNLTSLGLEHNQISDISALAQADLPSLASVGLGYNQIAEISALGQANLANVRRLSLSNNHISDISPLAGNASLGLNGDTYLALVANCIDLQVGSQTMNDINALQRKGVYVAYDPQRALSLPPCTN